MIIPIDASDDEIRALAASTQPGEQVELAPAWDGATPEFAHANRLGLIIGLPGANRYQMGACWHLVRTLRISELTAGADVVRVWRVAGNIGLAADALAQVYRSAVWNPSAQRIDLLVGDDPEVQRLADAYGIPCREG